MTLHADCLPILIVDRARPAIAVVHAGWRGTVADVTGATVRAMGAAFGSRAHELLVYVGPGIGAGCYHVGADVVEAWRAFAGRDAEAAFGIAGGQTTFDGRAANRLLLDRAGVAPDRIEVSDVCTRCHSDAWFSHRGQGPATGRFGAVIALVADGA
jgi:YfiH family protein